MQKLISISPSKIANYEYIDTNDHDPNIIYSIIEERSRFSAVNELIEKLRNIPDAMSQYFTPHFYINTDSVNDAYLCVLAVYYAYRDSHPELGELIVLASPAHNPATWGGGNCFNDDYAFSSMLENNLSPDEKEILESLKSNINPVIDLNIGGSVFCRNDDSFINSDPNGNRLMFYISVRRVFEPGYDMMEFGSPTAEKEYADRINFIYVPCGQDSNTEISQMLREGLVDKGFDVSKVEKRLAKLTADRKDLTEYTIQQYENSILNQHLLNSPDSMVITEADFQNLHIKKVEKQSENKTVAHKLVGLKNEREKVDGIVKMLTFERTRRDMGIYSISNGCNMVFAGPPGTAKTTIAREFAAKLAELGFIQSATNFRECRKSDIVGAYVGWTARQVDSMFAELHDMGGGVIFFDEIYTLSEKNSTSFDTEAVTCIVQNMENYRDSIYCIFAGYENKMDEFLSANPGIRSRISFTVKFEYYDNTVLNSVFESIAASNGFSIPTDFHVVTDEYFDRLKLLRGDQFGNGREARNLFTNTVQKMAIRLSSHKRLTKKIMTTLDLEDIRAAASDILGSEIRISNNSRHIGF